MMSKRKIIGAGSVVTAFAAVAVALNMYHSNAMDDAVTQARIEGRQEAVTLFSDTLSICETGTQEQQCGQNKMDLMLMSMGAKIGL